MKRAFSILFIVLSVLFVASCNKADLKVVQGSDSGGSKGSGSADIPPANSDPTFAYVSSWFKTDSSMWTYVGAVDSSVHDTTYFDKYLMAYIKSQDTVINFHAVFKMPAISQRSIASGNLFFYIKDSTDPHVPIAAWRGNENNYFGVGVTNAALRVPYYIHNSAAAVGVFQVNTTWYGYSSLNNPRSIDFDPTHPNHDQIAPKTNLFVRCIILGATYRTTNVRWNDYPSVQRLLGLKD